MKIVDVLLYHDVSYDDSPEYHVAFNTETITQQLMDKLLIVLASKDTVKWNKDVPEGWKYTYEYTSDVELDNQRSLKIILHNLEGPVREEMWMCHFAVVDLEEV